METEAAAEVQSAVPPAPASSSEARPSMQTEEEDMTAVEAAKKATPMQAADAEAEDDGVDLTAAAAMAAALAPTLRARDHTAFLELVERDTHRLRLCR